MLQGQSSNILNPKPQRLTGDLEHLLSRLSEARGRLDKIGDQLHGSAPEAVGNALAAPPPSTMTLRRYIDLSHEVLTRIEQEIGRIEDRL